MTDYFVRIQRFFQGRTPMIWSFDNVHTSYVDPHGFGHAR